MKNKKKHFGLFLIILGQKRIFFGKSASESSEKINEQIPSKAGSRLKDGRTGKHEFIGPPLPGIQKKCIFKGVLR